MKLIIDADHLVYRAAGSCEPTKAKPYRESPEQAIWRVEDIIAGIAIDLNSQDWEFYIGGENNWRKIFYPEYKANRKDVRIPEYNELVREHLVLKYKAEIVNDKEVDDACGIRLTQEGDNGVCVSLDKDLLTVPGNHWNFVKRKKYLISPLDGLRNFYGQLITGDASDNIPGFDGKIRSPTRKTEDGYKYAIFLEKLLEPLEEMAEERQMYSYVKRLYEEAILSLPGAHHSTAGSVDVLPVLHRNAKLLYIWRKEDDSWQIPGQMLELETSS